jgi:hypothetical protein
MNHHPPQIKFRANNDEVEAAEFGKAFHVLLFLIHGVV